MIPKVITGAFISVTAIFLPIESILITMSVLIMADLVFGIWASLKRGERFQSAVLSHTVIKFVVYTVAILNGYLVEHYLMRGIFPLCNMVAGIVGFVEFTSLLENLEGILGQPIFKSIIDQLKRRVDDDVKPAVIVTQTTASTSQTVIQEEMKRPDNE